MKLEKGKTYLTRSGTKVRIIETGLNLDEYSAIGVAEYYGDKHSALTFTANGTFNIGDSSDGSMDLVEECVDKPEFDRSLLPAWANKAIAMDSDGFWFCFSGRPEFVAGGVWGRLGLWVCEIPLYCAPKWEGAAEGSLLVWEDEE